MDRELSTGKPYSLFHLVQATLSEGAAKLSRDSRSLDPLTTRPDGYREVIIRDTLTSYRSRDTLKATSTS